MLIAFIDCQKCYKNANSIIGSQKCYQNVIKQFYPQNISYKKVQKCYKNAAKMPSFCQKC